MFLDAFPGLDDPDVGIATLRRCDDDLFNQFAPPAELVTGTEIGGVPCLAVTTPVPSGARTVLWFHGGGYIIGSASGRRGLAARIAAASSSTVVLPDYRLAPEGRFPAAVDDAVAVYASLSERHDVHSLAVGGESAGGGLALACLLKGRNIGLPMPAAVVAISPLADWTMEAASHRLNAHLDPIVSRAGLHRARDAYLAGHSPTDPLASPVHGDLTGLPPLFLVAGSAETLLDDARALADHAIDSDVEVELRIFEDMFHLWPLFADVLPEGAAAVELIGDFLCKHLTD